ncbi:Peptidase M12B domain-containing protein [Tenacibaculum sp. 190524A05c]|uniref:reprolysin-like metallopeptidase n=1 Tax=Tenacibaculum platacis TaxID=3137852 RepID=UPI0031FB7279
MKRITFVLVLFCAALTNAQSSWKKMNSENFAFRAEKTLRKTQPKKYSIYNLDIENFKNELSSQAKGGNRTINLPSYNGNLEKYTIRESSNFTEPLDPKYGFIKSYSIQGINDKTESGKISIGTDGVHITIFSGNHPTFYVDPYTKDNKTYISYNRSDIDNPNHQNHCLFDENKVKQEIRTKNIAERTADDGQLRTYRLALACTGEYAQFHVNQQGVTGGTDAQQRAAVLSAMNTTMTRVNGIYEIDLAVRMNIVLVSGSNPLIFLNAATDNLTNNSAGTLINESQSICDNVIGNANYDIGHTFSTGAGGLAGLGVVCVNSQKGRGITGTNSPINDPYDVDFVAHEIGHQFGAPHTFNNSCNGNRSNADAVEPGSGSTIMAYAGICPTNVQNNSDDYFHTKSITSMWNHIQSTSCATTTATGNSSPVANAGADVSVPKGTPLVLRGSATDADGTGGLTYCWEQMDIEIATMPPVSGNTGGPLFRSLDPSTSPDRYLPALRTVRNGSLATTWEVIPTVAREMNFALLVRDNNAGGGAADRDDIKITVTDANPFTVTSQNTAVTWDVGSTQTITWDKSTTDQAPINCQNVRILLSTDGGTTFPIILANSTPNDGTHDITVPNNATSSARIIVEGVDNIFYNMNSTNFSIVSNVPTFVLSNTTSKQNVCNSGGASAEYDLNIDLVNGFSETISFNASNAPSGSTVTFSPTTISSNGTVKMTVSNLDGASANNYNITVNATSTSVNQSVNAELEVSDGSFSLFNLSSPSNGATGVSIVPNLTWSSVSQAESYDVQIATDNAFTNVVLNANSPTNTYTVTPPLGGSTQYFWRVRGRNSCGVGNYTNAFSFTTNNPSYCASTFTDEAGGGDHITNVTFNTINNTTGNDIVDGYIDYTSTISTDVNAGDSYQISVTFDPDGFQDHCYVFIDWNQDFNFDVSTERYDLGSISGSPGSRTANITVPNDAVPGNTRMRVIIQYFDGTNFLLTDGACDSDHASEWGETEDYTVNVINNTASVGDFDFTNFNVYPNPSNGNFNITFEVINTESVGIRLFDIRGRLVEEKEFKNTQSTFSEELNLEGINAGLYLLQVQNGNKRTTKKLIIK